MPNDPGAERYGEFYKFIATVDAAAVIAALTLQRDLGVDPFNFGTSMLCFGVSAYLCIAGMFFITVKRPGRKMRIDTFLDNPHRLLASIVFLLTTAGISFLASSEWLFGG